MRILSLPSHVDIVAVGVMQELQNIRQPRLQELAAGVPQTLLQSRAESTVQKYTRSFEHWKKWAAQYPEISKFPALPAHVALYLQHLLVTSKAKTAVDDAVNALLTKLQLKFFAKLRTITKLKYPRTYKKKP